MPAATVHLASASPRRRELLAQIGVAVQLVAVPVDESRRSGEAPSDYVRRLARAKAAAAREGQQLPAAAVVLAADTAVVCGDDILGKPADAADAGRMLGRLSAGTHEVLTAVAVSSSQGESVAVSRSRVSFRAIDRGEAERYWHSGEPADKAGGYAIQGLGALFVSDLQGSYSGVMGLPLFETGQLLTEHGLAIAPAVSA